MTDELSALNLSDDLEAILALPEAQGWSLEAPGPLEIWVKLVPARDPEETFQARLLWTAYPDAPPSLKFRDPATGRLDMPTAWPQAAGFRPTSLDACVNWTSEGQTLHPEWKNDPRYRWDSRRNPLLRVVRELQDNLDTTYQGRFRQ